VLFDIPAGFEVMKALKIVLLRIEFIYHSIHFIAAGYLSVIKITSARYVYQGYCINVERFSEFFFSGIISPIL
jgi:hypothetical protein